MTSFSRTFYILPCVSWLCDHVTWYVTVWSCHSNPNPRFTEKKSKSKKKKEKRLNKKLTFKLHISDKRSGIDKQISADMRKDYRTKISIIYYLSTSNTFDSIMDNNYLSFVLPKTSVKVNILLLVHTLLPV